MTIIEKSIQTQIGRMSSMDIIYPGVSADRNKVMSATSSPEK
jgi:hypothetical protein